MSEIKNTIKTLNGRTSPVFMLCTVKTVDEQAATCDCQPLDDGAELLAVSLQAINDANNVGLVLYPKPASIVLVAILNASSGSAVVIQYSELSKISLNIGGTYFIISEGKILLNSKTETQEHAVLGNTLKTDLSAMNDRIDRLYALVTAPTFAASVAAAIADGGATYNGIAQPILSTAPARPVLNILSNSIQIK